jgi:hypothetical protein
MVKPAYPPATITWRKLVPGENYRLPKSLTNFITKVKIKKIREVMKLWEE